MAHFKVIKASAGSGKTFTLVKQYLALAFSYPHQYGYQKILAITFTNKAAGEMKERVINYLRGLAEGTSSTYYDAAMANGILELVDLDKNTMQMRAQEMLTHMVHHYNDIAISTIDTFVHRLIRSFARDLQLNLDFEVEMDLDIHLTQALENVMQQIGTNKALTKYVMQFVTYQMNEKGKWKISRDLSDFANNNLFNEKGAAGVAKLAKVPLENFSKIIQTIKKQVESAEKSAKQAAKAMLNDCDAQGLDLTLASHHKLNFVKKVAKSGLVDPAVNGWKVLNEGTWLKSGVKEPNKSQHESLVQALVEKLNPLYANYDKHLALKALYKELYATALLKQINEELELIKKENNLLFISDFNQKISNVIQNEPAPFIYERIGERYNHILIDEFQDTSTLQWKNLLPLVENSLSKNKTSLIVGDGKQSIYRFRNGDVEQFANLPQLKNEENNLVISQREALLTNQHNPEELKHNFRSSHHIIDFNNWFFNKSKNALSTELVDIYSGLDQQYLKEKPGLVKIQALSREQGSEEVIISQLIQEINDLKAKGHALNKMAILVSKNKEAQLIAERLLTENIPVISQGSLSFGQSNQVQLIVQTLVYILHPNHLFTCQSLALLVCKHLNIQVSSFMSKAFPEKTENLLAKELDTVLKEPLPKNVTGVSLYELIEQIIVCYNFNEQINPFVAGVLDFAHQFQQKFGSNFQGFIVWMNDKGYNKAISMPENIDAVQLLTIHSSKGLQYATVFVPNLKQNRPNKNIFHWVDTSEIIHELPSAAVKHSTSLSESAFKNEINTEEEKLILDSYNLLYVALTRPESNLFIWTDTEQKYSTFDKYLAHVFTHPSWDLDKNSLTLGEAAIPAISQTDNNTIHVTHFNYSQWNNLENISFAAPEEWEYNALFEKTDYGNMYHEILAHINTIEDIPTAIEKEKHTYCLTPTLVEEVNTNLHELLQHPVLKPWFNKDVKAINEQAILTASGQVLRPDRVVFLANETIIIDYKTGHFAPSYLKQLAHYSNALQSLGYKNIKKYLVFIETKEVQYYE